jgi:hypothetical protein
MKKFDTALERAYFDLQDLSLDFRDGYKIKSFDKGLFCGNDMLVESYRHFFNSFAYNVKERCFVSCIKLLDNFLGRCTRELLRGWHFLEFPLSALEVIWKYFSISNFYASIYREMDYEFFICFDQYLNKSPSVFSDSEFLSFGFDKIHILNVCDNKRFFIDGQEHTLSYNISNTYSNYSRLSREGFVSTDGLRLLAIMPSEEGLRIFSYLLRKYNFNFYDILKVAEILVRSKNSEYLSVLLNNYNFLNENNSSMLRGTQHARCLKTEVAIFSNSLAYDNCCPVCIKIFTEYFGRILNFEKA